MNQSKRTTIEDAIRAANLGKYPLSIQFLFPFQKDMALTKKKVKIKLNLAQNSPLKAQPTRPQVMIQ